MIISFFLWCIGMLILKDYHYNYKDGLCFFMAVAGIFELLFEMVIIGKSLGLGA